MLKGIGCWRTPKITRGSSFRKKISRNFRYRLGSWQRFQKESGSWHDDNIRAAARTKAMLLSNSRDLPPLLAGIRRFSGTNNVRLPTWRVPNHPCDLGHLDTRRLVGRASGGPT